MTDFQKIRERILTATEGLNTLEVAELSAVLLGVFVQSLQNKQAQELFMQTINDYIENEVINKGSASPKEERVKVNCDICGMEMEVKKGFENIGARLCSKCNPWGNN